MKTTLPDGRTVTTELVGSTVYVAMEKPATHIALSFIVTQDGAQLQQAPTSPEQLEFDFDGKK